MTAEVARKVHAMLHAARPAFYSLQPIKAALVQELGAESAAAAYGQMAGQKPGWSVSRLPLVSLQAFAEKQAPVYENLVSGRPMLLTPPPVFGGTQRPVLSVTTRNFFFCVIADAVVSSKSNVIVASGLAVLDFQDDELIKAPVNLDVDPIVIAPTDHNVTVIRAETASSPPLQTALSLVGIHSYAFGHWILEFLPKVWACLDRPGFDSLAILIDEQMPAQHREALEFFVGADHPIVVLRPGQAVRVKQLWACSMIVYMPPGLKPGAALTPDAGSLDGRGYASLIAKTRPHLDALPVSAGPKRLYLTRKDTQWRRLVNRKEVEQWLAAQGFSIVDLAELSFRKQLELIRGADYVLGPDGSAFMMAFFARAGTRIGIFNHEYLDDFEWYAQTLDELGLRFSVLVGDTVERNPDYLFFSNYRVELARLAAFLVHLRKIAARHGFDLAAVVVVRSPGHVAQSLDRREHMNPLIGVALWWHYMSAAIAAARGIPNAIAAYEEVLHSPKKLFDGLSAVLGLAVRRGPTNWLQEPPPAYRKIYTTTRARREKYRESPS